MSNDIEKWLDYIGKEVYTIDTSIPGHPIIKTIKISSIEIYPGGTIQLKSNNEGAYYPSYANQLFFLDRESAEEEFHKKYDPETLNLNSLRTCPKCDGIADIKMIGSYYFIECHDCGLQTNRFWKLKDAIDNWNN